MNCTQADDLLSEFIDGELAPDTSRDLTAHLGMCDACAAAHRQMLRTVRFVRSNADVDIVPGTTGALYALFTRTLSDPASPARPRDAITTVGFTIEEGDLP